MCRGAYLCLGVCLMRHAPIGLPIPTSEASTHAYLFRLRPIAARTKAMDASRLRASEERDGARGRLQAVKKSLDKWAKA
jgi:hypothetical protein